MFAASYIRTSIVAAGLWGMLCLAGGQPARAASPVILDTDIGTGAEDAFALALLLAHEDVELQAVTTSGNDAANRAWIVCRLLTETGNRKIPVAYGRNQQTTSKVDGQIQYRRHAAVVWDRTSKPVKETAVELLHRTLKNASDKVTLVCTGPLTNIARLLEQHPGCKSSIEQIVFEASMVPVGDGPQAADTPNARHDQRAARIVLASRIKLVAVPAVDLPFQPAEQKRLFSACTPLTLQVQNLVQLARQGQPSLAAARGAAFAVDPTTFGKFQDAHLESTEAGLVRQSGEPNTKLATSLKTDSFVAWYIRRVRSYGETSLPDPPKNISQTVERGGLPKVVHAFEDYETDIEKRWWMSGIAETGNVPPGSTRACRAVLTQDFDAKMGNTNTMYTAVVFNPVPGPPMGKNTRVTFRYRLNGTDRLRVQLFSLSKGYHRYLSLKGLAQGEWQTATVDMTQMRRPDGSGGPLEEHERIDDIQFYVDPRAELLIDDVVLYDAGPAGEKRPFPKNILFTGWFDTGRQGREWPGDFEIVPHKKPRRWDAARSVVNEELGKPWLRFHFRGDRPLPETTRVRFRFRLTGAEQLQAVLRHSHSGLAFKQQLSSLKQGSWNEATVTFNTADNKSQVVDELQLVLPAGAELLVDDLLVYEPGQPTRAFGCAAAPM